MKWRIQFISLVVMMACLTAGGIHLAERGIHRVDGFRDLPAQSFHISREENGRLEMTVLGRRYSFEQENLVPFAGPSSSERIALRNWAGTIGHSIDHWISAISKAWVDIFQ